MTRLFALFAATAVALAVFSGPATAADERKGREVYDLHCIVCHGPQGMPADPTIPSFADGDTLFQMDSDLMRRISEGKETMPAFRGLLTAEEMRDVIAYIRTF